MSDEDYQRFTEIMQMCGWAFREEILYKTCACYFEFLKNYPLDTVEKAFVKAIHTCKEFPPISVLRATCEKITWVGAK